MGWLYGLTDDEVNEFPGLITKLVPKGAVEVTEKPVEGGIVITDHSILKAFRFSATVFVSPVETRPGLATTVKAATDLIILIISARTVNTVGITGDVGPWEELILETFQVVREFEQGNGGEFELEFIQLKYARAVTNAPLPRHPRDRRRVTRGPQSTTPAVRESLWHASQRRLLGDNLVTTPNR